MNAAGSDDEERLNTADAEARAEQYKYAAHLRKLAARENAKFDKVCCESKVSVWHQLDPVRLFAQFRRIDYTCVFGFLIYL